MTDWTYSHTQIDLWNRCKRLYHARYILGIKEPKTPAMAAGTHLLHFPIETILQAPSQPFDDAMWEMAWANFLAEINETDTYDDPIYTLKLAKRCLDLYKQSPVEGDVECVEQKFVYTFPDGLKYVSIPDFINTVMPTRRTVDLKLTTAWRVNPLLPYDDQCLGQAVCCGADGFVRGTWKVDKKTGKVDGPIWEEHIVDPVLRDQWIEETWATCREIESWRQKTHASWPKNDDACYAFGRECHMMNSCKNGFLGA